MTHPFVATGSELPGEVVVVGSGVAGLSVALGLAEATPAGLGVTVLSKTGFGDGSSRWARGGIAGAVGDGDSPRLHAADTLAVAAGLGAPEIVDILTGEGPQRIHELIRRGARFDRDADGALQLGLEGGHRRPRVIHAQGDATGAELMRALTAAVRSHPAIRWVERMRATDLLLADGRIAGVSATGPDGPVVYPAAAVVLATGGFGHAFLRTTNPPEATGDGVALAARAGALLADLEFVQFHPTALAVADDPMPLLTEALRGAGALLVDARGRRFMPAISPAAELAPRDLVARAIWERRAAGDEVLLDCRPALAKRDFPTVVEACRHHGLDPYREAVPVSPAAHYTMGGVVTDDRGRTTLTGLWACGEVAATAVHGANRLASNSLLEGLVFGARVAEGIVSEVEPAAFEPQGPVWSATGSTPTAAESSSDAPPVPTLPELRAVLWERAGLVRTELGLLSAIRDLRRLAVVAGPVAELRDLATVGLLVATAALARRESRGAHFRRDFPTTDPGWRRRLFFLTDAQGSDPRPVEVAMTAEGMEALR